MKKTLLLALIIFNLCLVEVGAQNTKDEKPDLIPVAQTAKKPASIQSWEAEVVKLVNSQRSNRGLQTLKSNWEIARVARYKSQDMINKNYFSHISPTFGSPFKMMESFGIRFSAAGENIAMGQRTPSEVMNSWMNSPGHRANILSPSYTTIGVGLAKSKTGVCYWTQMFTKPTK